jgi:hypothetical protein
MFNFLLPFSSFSTNEVRTQTILSSATENYLGILTAPFLTLVMCSAKSTKFLIASVYLTAFASGPVVAGDAGVPFLASLLVLHTFQPSGWLGSGGRGVRIQWTRIPVHLGCRS